MPKMRKICQKRSSGELSHNYSGVLKNISHEQLSMMQQALRPEKVEEEVVRLLFPKRGVRTCSLPPSPPKNRRSINNNSNYLESWKCNSKILGIKKRVPEGLKDEIKRSCGRRRPATIPPFSETLALAAHSDWVSQNQKIMYNVITTANQKKGNISTSQWQFKVKTSKRSEAWE